MVEDVTIGVAIFLAFVVLAMVGRRAGLRQIDIWGAA